MKIIGLTGSIGMGKSVAAKLLRVLRIPVHDSDAVVHQLLSPYGAAFSLVARTFPEAWDAKTHTIDRKKLAEIIFKDSAKKKLLEDLLHPLVWQSQKKFILKARRMGLKKIVLDIPLLYETRAEGKCDEVMCVSAPYFLQRQRVLSRPGMSEEKFLAIIAAQIPDIEKRHRSHVVIPTGLGRAFTLQKIKRYLERFKK